MIKICLATQKEDFEQIEKLGSVIWGEHYTPIIGVEQVEYMLDKFQSVSAIKSQILEGFEYYSIYFKEAAVGYLSVVKNEDALFLSKFYISKNERGKGIGKHTLDFVIDKASGLGLSKISLTVNKYNSNSIKAYEKMGFKIIDSTIVDIGNGFKMDDFVMVKTIK
jgi:GNAT superfamily N-acetyltransferase